MDGDSNPEILALVDTDPGVGGQHGLQIFEWDPVLNRFPDTPTTTWDMLMDSVWEAGQILAAELDGDDSQEIILSVMDGPWGSQGSSRFLIFELENNDLESPSWNMEYEDYTTTNWSGYNISVGDLDQDGLIEIYIIANEYYHLIIYENLGSHDAYEYQTDFYVSLELHEQGNQSIIIANLDGDNTNELYAVTSGTNTLTGTLLTPGYFYAVQGADDIMQLTFENFNYFSYYPGGLRQINIGDADGDGNPNLYLAGHYNEALYDWEYLGGDPLAVENYSEHIIFMDDTTDNFTPENDQGRIRMAKVFAGDIDNDGQGDLLFSSASFAPDKPLLYMIEHTNELSTGDEGEVKPDKISLRENYPNPFNPKTQFSYYLPESGIIELAVYDILGKEVYKFFNGYQQTGKHNVLWTGIDNHSSPVPSGVYFYRLISGSKTITKKLVLTK